MSAEGRIRQRRYRRRIAGQLPPVPTCRRCGHRCLVDHWLPFCGSCADVLGAPGTPAGTPSNPLRRAALEVLWDLRRAS